MKKQTMINYNLLYRFIISTSLIVSFFLSGCSDDKDIEKTYLWVAPERIKTYDGHGQEIFLLKVKKMTDKDKEINDEGNFNSIYGIVGFEYEEGYSYILYVKIEPNPIAKEAPDAYPYIYTLLKAISKEKANESPH